MLKQVFSSVKADRTLTLDNWRYKLFHWCFNVDRNAVQEALDSGDSVQLSRVAPCIAVYTHFCPLFHLTNLIFVFSPLIILAKLIYFIAKVLYVIGCFLVKSIRVLYVMYPSIPRIKRKVKKEVKKQKKVSKYKDIWKLVHRTISNSEDIYDSFSRFWDKFSEKIDQPEDKVRLIFDKYMDELKKQQEALALQKIKRRERIYFWVNFSSMFFKGILNVLYIGMMIAAIVLAVPVAIGLFHLIIFMFSGFTFLFFGIPWFFVMKCILAGLAFVSICAAIAFVLIITGIQVQKSAPKIMIPLEVVGGVFKSLGLYIARIFQNCIEFIELFYEENCPAITIVKKDE